MGPRIPRAKVDGLVVRELPEEVLVYDLDRHEAHCLDRTSAAIWRRCDGRSTAAQIAKGLGGEISPLDADLVWVALQRLDKAHLLEARLPKRQAPSLPRRELLKRVAAVGGLSVLTITVPTAALAISCIARDSTLPADCVDGTCTAAGGRTCCSGKCAQKGQNCGSGGGFNRVCL